MTENDIVGENREEKTVKLFDATLEAASTFLSSHNLEVKFPQEITSGFARSIEEGVYYLDKAKLNSIRHLLNYLISLNSFSPGRGKMKKMIGPIALAIGAKLVALIPIFLGGLVLLATKALVVAKIAFILAASLAAQKLIGGGGSGFNLLSKFSGAGNVAQGWSAGGNQAGWSTGGGAGAAQGWSSGAASSQYPYARSYDAQEIAYNGQVPATTQ